MYTKNIDVCIQSTRNQKNLQKNIDNNEIKLFFLQKTNPAKVKKCKKVFEL